ncbi:unnamed protein product [Arctia plantaginis]|uniref:Uncharacterized protein n=1 Tax=Arctia plantaginis TaxID=874455 RepID=A0A8S0Z1F2_ARCPL|nr:unnamed protein product [Arctia plantaginis]
MEKNERSSSEEKGTKSYLQFQIERLKVLQAKLSTEADEDYVIVKEEAERIARARGTELRSVRSSLAPSVSPAPRA